MINLKKISSEAPYRVFKDSYDEALKNKQNNIEAICISSFSKNTNEVNARFVNLKFIQDKKFIFFSNYDSPKAQDFSNHKQITALIYWQNINLQIRMKATIKKTSNEFNNKYFSKRSKDKNALAISSHQSKTISSYQEVIKKYQQAKTNKDLSLCPDYWGGFSFKPYYFEFWQGHQSRINKREVFDKINGIWKHSFLQP
ncbi:pyridoxal 5'-phosphate synthase [Gammaproteobacteria bacterium]|nr:pyridoxal 5'-phosphate synthase [Gammaproteobacteria bacterium]